MIFGIHIQFEKLTKFNFFVWKLFMNALLVVDMEVDFLPGGALAVKEGDLLVPLINDLMMLPFDVVVACKDWHPSHHVSFASTHGKKAGDKVEVQGLEQVLWPDHCVQNTPGSTWAPGLKASLIAKVFLKGTDPQVDSYSAFFDNARLHSTGLADYLRAREIQNVFIVGLATDYCVKCSALDALELGFGVYLVLDACRGVEWTPGEVDRAVEVMTKAGAKIISSATVPSLLKKTLPL